MYYKLVLSLALVLINSNAWAEETLPTSGTCGTDCTWSYDAPTKTIKITGNESGTGVMDDYDYREGYNIKPEWYGYNEIAENIIITGVKNVGHQAFWKFESVKNIEMDNNVTTLAQDSLAHMRHLETIQLSNNLTSIGWSAFTYDGADNPDGFIPSLVLPETLKTVRGSFVGLRVDTLVMPANLDINKDIFTLGNVNPSAQLHMNHVYCTGEKMEACSDALKEAGVDIEPTRYEKTADGVVVYDDKGHIVGKYKNTQAIGDGKIDVIYKYSDSGHFIGTFDAKGNRIGKKIYTVEEAMEATKNGNKFHVYLTYK